MVAIDLPTTTGHEPERVVVAVERRGVVVNRGPQQVLLPNGNRAKRTDVWLTYGQWLPVDRLRQKWCRQPPTYEPVAPEAIFYDVVIDCPGLADPHFRIPFDQLPGELLTIIDAVPSPT